MDAAMTRFGRTGKALALAGGAVALSLGLAGVLGQAPGPRALALQASDEQVLAETLGVTERTPYRPGTETLGSDEMRVVACGTGMPNARPKQAAACFLVELGNGDKFLFDIGTGSAERISAQKIPYDLLDKVFIGHLHSDHMGDLDALWIGGVISNRQRPLRIWGPSSTRREWGTAYAVEKMNEMYSWDSASRLGNVNTLGLKTQVQEFDYTKVNHEIYNANGVVIKSLPAVHALDGSVSYTLEWNGLKFAFSSDTYPNKWWIENTKGADIAIHESFLPPNLLVTKQKFPVADALNVGTQVHTSPAQFGKVMALTKPRLAVAYHFFNDADIRPDVAKQIRSVYDGPVALATDYMVFNISKKNIRVRMSEIDEDIFPQPSLTKKLPADPSQRVGFTPFIASGKAVFKDVLKKTYAMVNEMFGTDIQPPL
ncbi:MAG: guanitoxin biosynthesis MBL fold metallo-hydrolase GntH [Synechococcus sp.]|nr:guanitoxin biosynthesis MBL fold metallo-hydrolase GntH [Synechococcus sp.]